MGTSGLVAFIYYQKYKFLQLYTVFSINQIIQQVFSKNLLHKKYLTKVRTKNELRTRNKGDFLSFNCSHQTSFKGQIFLNQIKFKWNLFRVSYRFSCYNENMIDC